MRRWMYNALLMVVVATGCKGDPGNAEGSAPGATTNVAQAAVDGTEEAMGLYAEGYNAILEAKKDIVDEYRNNVPETGPDEISRVLLRPSNAIVDRAINKAKQAFAKAKQVAPESMKDMAASADAILSEFDKSHETFRSAQAYYAAQDFKDDSFAKGKELHGLMMQSSQAFLIALRALDNQMIAIEDRQAEAELATFAADKSYGYWFRKHNVVSKRFVRAWNSAEDADNTKLFAELQSATDALSAFARSKTDVKPAFKAYADAAVRLLGIAKQLQRDSTEEAANKQLGRQLIDAYNALVQLTNSLYELESMDQLS